MKKQKSCYVAPRNMLNLLIVIIFVSRVRMSHFLTTQEIWGCILIAHFQQLCKSLFFELRKISHMRAFLNEASLQKLVTSFVLSRMDYCNSLLVNLPNDTITKLQRIQNHAARLVLKKAKRDHVTPLFRILHWLSLQARINYKICVLCFKCINKTAPSYLSDLLEQYVPSHLLRSGSQNLLKLPPRAHKKCTEKAFKHCALSFWNSLPSDIREAKSESQFKKDLKTHLLSPIFVFEFLSH